MTTFKWLFNFAEYIRTRLYPIVHRFFLSVSCVVRKFNYIFAFPHKKGWDQKEKHFPGTKEMRICFDNFPGRNHLAALEKNQIIFHFHKALLQKSLIKFCLIYFHHHE